MPIWIGKLAKSDSRSDSPAFLILAGRRSEVSSFIFRYQDRTLDNILKLAHIAGPGITFETSERIRGN